MTSERDHDPAGWFNFCPRRLPDGTFCGLRYWYAWVPSRGSGTRFTGRDSGVRHECRAMEAMQRG